MHQKAKRGKAALIVKKEGKQEAGAAERPTGPKKEFAPMQIKKEGPSSP